MSGATDTLIDQVPTEATTPAEGSPADPAASDAAGGGSDLSPDDQVALEARKRFDRIADRHERQDAAGEGEAPPAEEAASEGADSRDAQETGSEEPAESAGPPEGFDEALAALLRDGTLSEQRLMQWFQDDPQDFIKAGQKAAKRQKDVDRRLGGQFKAKAGQAAQAAPQETTQPPAQAPEPPKDFIEATKRALDDVLQGLADDDLYGDLKEPLGVAFTGLAEQMGTYMAAELAKRDALLHQIHAEAEQQKEEARAARVESEIQSARAALKAKYPDIADDSKFQDVLSKYDLIVNGLSADGPQYQTVGEVLTEAAKWVFSDANPANAADRIKQNLFKRSAQQQRGLPSARATPTTERKLTADEKARQIFERIADKHEGAMAT